MTDHLMATSLAKLNDFVLHCYFMFINVRTWFRGMTIFGKSIKGQKFVYNKKETSFFYTLK